MTEKWACTKCVRLHCYSLTACDCSCHKKRIVEEDDGTAGRTTSAWQGVGPVPPPSEHGLAKNTDRELFREKSKLPVDPDNYYAPSCHVTEGGALGINVGGMVHVKPLRDWHALAEARTGPPSELGKLLDEARNRIKDILYSVRYGKDDGKDQELAALAAVKRLRAALNALELQRREARNAADNTMLLHQMVEREREGLREEVRDWRASYPAHKRPPVHDLSDSIEVIELKQRLETAHVHNCSCNGVSYDDPCCLALRKGG